MGYFSDLAQKYIDFDYDRSYPSPEEQLLWRLDDLNYKLEELTEKEQVEDLKNRCEKVLNNHTLAKDLLPTMKGFLFGSTEYDENYYNDVKQVLQYCETTLLPMFDELDSREGIYFNTWY